MTALHTLVFKIVAFVVLSVALSSCTLKNIVGSLLKEDEASYVRIWFVKPYDTDVALVPVMRPKMSGPALKTAVTELLKGPSEAELNQGLASEIPKGTILLGLKNTDGNLELDLSRRFASGGGASSMETRLEQLSRTVADAAGHSKVFLSVEGKRLSTYTGEGLEVKQPIN